MKLRLWSKLSWPVTRIICKSLCCKLQLSKRTTSFNKGVFYIKTALIPSRRRPKVADLAADTANTQQSRWTFSTFRCWAEKNCCNLSMLMLAVVHTELGSAGGARRAKWATAKWVSFAKLICRTGERPATRGAAALCIVPHQFTNSLATGWKLVSILEATKRTALTSSWAVIQSKDAILPIINL